MKLLNFCLLLFAFPLPGENTTHAQTISDPTEWRYEVKKKDNNEYQLVFHVELEEGWHIFSQKPGDDFLIPPSFEFNSSRDVKLVGKVTEKGKLKTERMEGIDNPVRYYEKTADFIQTVKAVKGTVVKGNHTYQVCNENMCLPPKARPFEFIINE